MLYVLFRVLQHDLRQLLARCWSKIRRCGRREQSPPAVGLALGLGVHHCARVMVAAPPGASRPARDEILLQNMATGPLRRALYIDENRIDGGDTIC